MKNMNKWGSSTISSMAILIAFTLISVSVASIMINQPDINSTKNIDKDFEKIMNQVLDEVSTYFQIKDIMGKFYNQNEEQKIMKIAILVKPLIIQDIDITDMTIKLSNSNSVKILYNSKNADFIKSYSLFEHPIWKNLTENNFGFIATLDQDKSIVENNIINEDYAYIIIKLSNDFSIVKGESLDITLFPYSGISRTITIKAPMPIKQVVTFD